MNSGGVHLEHIRLRDILLLDHLQETGSLRITAERLHVTQPAITQALQVLERSFGVVLVQRGVRGQRGVSLTVAGQAALVRMRVAREELLAAHAAALSPQLTLLRIAALPLALFDLVPKSLRRLKKIMPYVHVELQESSVAGLWQLLATGQVDAIVGRLPTPGEGASLPADIVIQAVSAGADRLSMVVARSHRVAVQRQPSLQELAQQDWVLPPKSTLTRQLFDQVFWRAGEPPPEASITSFSFHSNLRLAATGQWLTVAPHAAMHLYASALKLKALSIPWDSQSAGIFFVCRRSSLAHPGVTALQASFRSES